MNPSTLRELDVWIWTEVYGARLAPSKMCPKTFVCCIVPKGTPSILMGKTVGYDETHVSCGSFETGRDWTAGRYAPRFSTNDRLLAPLLEKCATKSGALSPLYVSMTGGSFEIGTAHIIAFAPTLIEAAAVLLKRLYE